MTFLLKLIQILIIFYNKYIKEYPAGAAIFENIKVETVASASATLDWQYYDEYFNQ